MNRGKKKCNTMKKIRKNLADVLNIDLHQTECTFEGECKGTCPKCKQEEDILNKEIAKRAGVLAIGATATLSLAACSPQGIFPSEPLSGDIAVIDEIDLDRQDTPIDLDIGEPKEIEELSGDMEYVPPSDLNLKDIISENKDKILDLLDNLKQDDDDLYTTTGVLPYIGE